MIAFIVLSSIVTPPLIALFLYTKVVDQKDQYGQVTETKKEAQAYVLSRMVKCPVAIMYYIWMTILFLVFTGLAQKIFF